MNKKSLIISNFDDPNNPNYGGGGAIAVAEAANILSKEFTVTVVVGKYPGAKNFNIGNVFYQRIGFGFNNPRLSQISYTLFLPFYVLTKKFDVWIESFTPPFSTGMLQLFTKKPVIGLVHMLSGEDMTRKYKLPFYLIERIGLKTYKYFIVTSKHVENKIYFHNKDARIKLIPNSVKKPRKIGAHNRKQILFIGRLEVNQKGIDLLLHAFKLSGLSMSYELIIGGDGTNSEKNKIYEIVESLQLLSSVKLIGRVSGRKKVQLLAESEFMVVPSRFETFSVACLEAISHGIPLITFNIKGLSWLPRDCRLSVTPFDVRALASNMALMSKKQEARFELSSRGLEFSMNYGSDKFENSYRGFLANI